MYECWIFTISESNRKIIVWGDYQTVYDFRKQLGHEDYGSGFTGRPLQEVQAIVDSLKINNPTAIEVKL